MALSLAESSDSLWFKDAIIYELHIKAFHDSNQDGIGDFAGLIERLDYLQDLGVTAIWLLPFYPSPQRDGGYDISDYFDINPDYGTLKQFKKLMKEAHKRGLKVITELVINHTSDQHPWFQRARKAKPGSRYRDFYVWSDTPEKYRDVRIIFQDFESSNWTWDSEAQAYYWHRFYSHQPDLNFDNPEVQQAIFKMIDFWVDLGVDGFRLDAIPYLFERDGTNCENLPETHAFLKQLRAHVEARSPHVMLLAEANMWPEDSAAYFGEGDECHMNYHFPIMPRMFMALKMEDRYPIIDIIDQTPEIPENCQWGMFLRNHDELTLEMVTDEERDYMYRAYNKDHLSRINLGIRHRLAPLLDNHRQKIELMNCLLFSMPGTPVIYYGDEIGMGDNVHLGDRDGVRTPMQWSPDRNAGFSRAHPHKLYLPLINDPEYHFETVNVETQQANGSSLLWWMKRMIKLRKRYQAFGRGDIEFLSPENAKVLAFTRSFKDEHILVVANLSRHPQSVDLEMPAFAGYRPMEMFGQSGFPEISEESNRFTLGPYGYYWFVLQSTQESEAKESDYPTLTLSLPKWTELGQAVNHGILTDKILPFFLTRNPFYLPERKTLEALSLLDSRVISFENTSHLLLIIKAEFTEGLPETYFLPVSFQEGEWGEGPENAKIAHLQLSKKSGWLYEARFDENFHAYLLSHLTGKKRTQQKPYRFLRKAGDAAWKTPLDIPRPGKYHGNASPLVFGDTYYLKIFRRLEATPNPDLEINRQSEAGLPVPGYLAHWEQGDTRYPFTLALLQPYVGNQGTAWQYFYDSARRYLERVQTTNDLPKIPQHTSLFTPLVSPDWQELISPMPLERAFILGDSIARLHKNLSELSGEGFVPEEFSLHYQRSLYASFQPLVRSVFSQLKKLPGIPAKERLLEGRKELLTQLKRIHAHKMDALKVRTHGDLHLLKVLFTGREFCVYDFEGERVRSYSELRLRRSPMRDIASLLCSLRYAALAAVQALTGRPTLEGEALLPWAEAWYNCMASEMIAGYLPEVEGTLLLPQNHEDREVLLDTLLIERSLQELQFELGRKRNMEAIPLQMLLQFLKS